MPATNDIDATVTTTAAIPGLRRVEPGDVRSLAHIAYNLGRIPGLLDDQVLLAPEPWFRMMFLFPANIVFDVADGAGLLAFVNVVPGFKAHLFGASWGREAMRRYDLWRAGAQVAILAHDLLIIESFTRTDNTLARRAMERAGMRYRGSIPRAAWYNSVRKDLAWYEITREELGLEGRVDG